MIQIATFLLFTAFVGYVAWRKTRHDDHESSTGYFLAGRSLPWVVVAGSLLLTNLSTEQIVGLNGGAFKHGMQVMAWEVWAAVAMVVMALVFLPRYLRGGVATVSQYLAGRYDKAVGGVVSLLLLLSLFTNLLPFVLYSGAKFMVPFFDLSEYLGGESSAIWITVVAIGGVASIYAVFGGLKAVAVSDTINGIGLFVGGLAIPFLALAKLGEGSVAAGVRYLLSHEPERLDPIGASGDNLPFATLFTGMVGINVYYWCTNQAIVQRTFAARSLVQGQKGVLAAAGLKLLGPIYLVLPGIIAWHLFADQLRDDPDGAYAMVAKAVLPSWSLGLFAAVIFGAILSSINSGLNSASTLFSKDLYKGFINPAASDAQMVRVGKIFGGGVAVVAIVAAPLIGASAEGLFDLMKKFAALYNIPLLAITVVGFFAPRVPALAAKVALAFGFVFYAVFGLWQDNALFGLEMHWLHLAGLNLALLVVIMLVIGRLCPRAEPYRQPYTGDVDIEPWRAAVPVGIGIVVLVVVIYLAMSRFG